MKRLWSASLAGQMVSLMLLALALSQGIGFLIYLKERAHAVHGVLKEEFLLRTASTARVVEATPPALLTDVMNAVGTTYTRYWLTTEAPGDASAWERQAKQYFDGTLSVSASPVQTQPAKDASINLIAASNAAAPADIAPWEELPASAWPLNRPGRIMELNKSEGFGLAVQLGNGLWLNGAFLKPITGWSPQSAVSLGLTALALSLIAIFTARCIAKPLRDLAHAAERLGRGEEVTPLPECGPDDVRCTAEAFNRMQARLRRFIEDRTRMLAALGHDLRTPITALRLRSEFVTDAAVRERLLATIDEMQAMTEAALAFAREEATSESTRTIDLGALVESMCDDLAELGWQVSFTNGERISYRCRPDAVRRALRNVIENAVRYGQTARVALHRSDDEIEITVDDDGPGIPEADFERVFEPFVRLEASRNRSTGGVGLGLSIARTIIRGHGGDILLANRAGGGLRVTIRLPAVGRL